MLIKTVHTTSSTQRATNFFHRHFLVGFVDSCYIGVLPPIEGSLKIKATMTAMKNVLISFIFVCRSSIFMYIAYERLLSQLQFPIFKLHPPKDSNCIVFFCGMSKLHQTFNTLCRDELSCSTNIRRKKALQLSSILFLHYKLRRHGASRIQAIE